MRAQDHLVLGIETSCDETAAAVVSSSGTILSNIIYSQIEEHKDYGGVIPEFAARAHLEKLPSVVDKAIHDAGIDVKDLFAIAATTHPGLIGCLHVGASFGRAFAAGLKRPFIAVNHLEAHMLTPRLSHKIDFPYTLVLVSGGHCQIIDVRGAKDYAVMGQTLDDSPGEVFDKIARLLGGSGGAFIESLARSGDDNRFAFPRPFLHEKKHANLSFSGLKTAVRLACEKHAPLDEQTKADVAACLQKAIAETLLARLKSAECVRGTVVISGGVARNTYLRKAIDTAFDRAILPPLDLCSDNAAMVAWAALESF